MYLMHKENPYSFVSIIMPIKNEERYIERSLAAVLNQDYPSEKLEVLIADGNSTDDTREKISEILSGSKISLKIIDNPTGVVPKALNLGLQYAKGEIIIRVDGHCEIQKDYVSVCVEHLFNGEAECVGGSIDTIGESDIAQAIALAMRSPFGVGGVAFRVEGEESKFTDSVPFPAYLRKVFDQIGLYDEEMLCNEDDEFNYRLRKNNGRILLLHNLRTRYYSRGSLSSLWKQYFRYGLWKVRILQKYPQQMRPRQFVPLAFVLVLILTVILAVILPWAWIPLVSLLGVYALANLVAAFLIASREAWRYFWPLPLAFATIHVGYGLGFLVGLLRFAGSW